MVQLRDVKKKKRKRDKGNARYEFAEKVDARLKVGKMINQILAA